MTIEIKQDRYFIGFWCVAGDKMDCLATVYRDKGEHEWRIVYRFRYHRDAKVGMDSTDEKHWYETASPVATTSEDKLEACMDHFCEVLVTHGMRGPVDKALCKSDDVDAVAGRLTAMQFAHVVPVSDGDAN